ncbi:MAG: hypothetical protein NZ845_03645 [Thermodesulfovibrio sp.]|nr:hypothetical protein [Thermodesulfovibrio sp.]MCX7723767.1 hypothetical protein [Thermodesulfovibrio sp.]
MLPGLYIAIVNLIHKRFIFVSFLLFGILIFGTLGYIIIELDALYMTV